MYPWLGELERSGRHGTVLVDRRQGGDWIDGGERYVVVCDTHKTLQDARTRRLGRRWMVHRREWCEGCRQ